MSITRTTEYLSTIVKYSAQYKYISISVLRVQYSVYRSGYKYIVVVLEYHKLVKLYCISSLPYECTSYSYYIYYVIAL
jgi:hypothetical protein